MHYSAIFISDIHLGTTGSQDKLLIQFLKQNSCDKLYLVGDIVDGWRLSKKWHWPNSHNNLIRHIITKAKQGTKVYWVLGNHDEMLRKFLDFKPKFGRIKIVDEIIHEGIDNKKYLVTHGDKFDGITQMAKWLVFIGDNAYTFLLWINKYYNKIRNIFGYKYWSLSAYLKQKTKKTLEFLYSFKKHITSYAKSKHLDGVICGHIHTPEIEVINDVVYMNDGDWVESCSALVETTNGEWQLIHYTGEDENINDNENISNNVVVQNEKSKS
jgi:UDP-2,3-diacylglucosamine pyrophosphatase LpxH